MQDDLVTNFGIAQGRTSLVPYGVHRCWLTVETRPARGRILFVGEANLRKGIHYFAMAAARLRRTSRGYALRVAGGVTPRVAEQSLCRGLEFLGRIPRDRLREEFAAADVFVLPSLSEGSAEATYEALAAGLPVVTTRAAGSVVRDGIEGRIVPEQDPVALADGNRRDRRGPGQARPHERRRAPARATTRGALWRAAHWRLTDPAGLTRHGTSAGAASLTAPTDGSRRSHATRLARSPRMAGLYLRWQATRVAMQRSPCTTIAAWADRQLLLFQSFLALARWYSGGRDAPAGGLPAYTARRPTDDRGGRWAHLGHFALALAASGFDEVHAFEPIRTCTGVCSTT